jgi:NAD(P)H-flavin reductase
MQRLVSVQPAAVDLVHLTFDAPPADHTLSGQYVVVPTPEGARGFFALASKPGAPAELLVKRGGAAADWLVAQPPGSEHDLGTAKGPGWQLPPGDEPVLILINGSGIAAVRGLIPELLAGGRQAALFWGALSPAHIAFEDDVRAWRERGMAVHFVWDSDPVRFVQDAAVQMGWLRPDVTLVLCGHNAMLESARARWAGVGTPLERIRTNF